MPDEKEFIHLHVHTEFSLLDGLSQIKRLVRRSAEAGMNALAITDHGSMFGVIDFYRACKKEGVKPIIGMEAYMARRGMRDRDAEFDARPYHLLLLAKDQTGYKNLLQIASASQLEGYYYRPRIDHDFLAAHSEGLVATSGCLAAEIPRMVTDGRENEALRLIGWHQDVFGPENFYLELQHHNIDELHALNKWLLNRQGYAQVPMVATNDVHYVLDDDYDAHDTLLCIQTGNVKSEQNRLRFSSRTFHLRTPHEMWQLFAHVPEALTNTLRIAEMCNVSLDSEGYHLPVFPVPDGYTAETYLRYLCFGGLGWRYGARADDPDVINRLDYELQVIHNMGFDTYFLIVWDLCEFARHADIWWNVRGSGAGSVAAYCLGITNIDPMQNGLLFERFLNPGRVSMPDIDLDYPEDRRAEMIQYCAHKYGEDKVAAIITFGTMGAKAAIRDVGRALDMPLPEVDRIARLIPTLPGKPIKFDDALGDDPERALPELKEVYKNDEHARKLIDTARQLEGITRHASTHAAGVIVADKPLVEYIPLHRPTKGSAEDAPVKMVTQFPMETCESIGLLKVDFLGLSTLTIMRRACELIEQYHGKTYDLSNIPYRPDPDDPDVTRWVAEMFEMIGRGETVGVFQLESQGMRRMLTDMRPTKFEHIVAGISLYRPGPMDYIPQYNRRLHGDEVTEYRHPLLEPILQETYGICVSGDSIVIDVKTGQRYRVDQVGMAADPIYVQGVDDQYCPAVGRVTHLIYNGEKPVYRITLKNGATIKTTHDHHFLTESGWQPLDSIRLGDYVGTPPQLIAPEEAMPFDRNKLRVLAYLIADGSLASGSSVDFVNQDQLLIDEYVRCLRSFGDLEPVYTEQLRGVQRVGVRSARYKEVNNLLAWMRELGFKYKPGTTYPRGVRSQEKSIPGFVFRLNDADLAFFLGSLWDCDGYVGGALCHYKTISHTLAHDVQTLLLRFGFHSTIHQAQYESSRGQRTAYQVTVYDTARLVQLLSPYMLTDKRKTRCKGVDQSIAINRLDFIQEVEQTMHLSTRRLMELYGIDRQHFTKKVRENRPRISAFVVASLAETVPLPQTRARIHVNWQEVLAIEPAGTEAVYDLTVEGTHNFVANNIIVHNCVYQEQIMQIAGQLFGYELGEADLMRRAVSKKKKEDLLKHRQIFIERGPEHGVDPVTAGAIFDDIEFFARYGFNKSHAADYAVLTCQTAYLKCHYPHEYMAALMSVHRDDSAKVGLFAADCARTGIAVLPPTVNNSELDFSIEKHGDGQAIRFGLGAIKNLGIGPAEHILDARGQGGPFRDLADFCHRVDTRNVNKRALESLIKVGALDEFAPRPALLAALDRIISFSADHHKAKDAGQMSLFGESTGVDFGTADSILGALHAVEQVTRREMLNWEKELVGLYVTDHPLKPVMDQLQAIITHTSADLAASEDEINGQPVIVAGLVTNIRSFATKKGDMMAILTIEDITGIITAVLFPRTWGEYRGIIDEDAVIIVYGKADNSRGDMQVIVDSVRQDFEMVAGENPSMQLDRKFSWLADDEDQEQPDDNGDPADVIPLHEPAAPPRPEPALRVSSSEPPSRSSGVVDDREVPGWLEVETADNGWAPQAFEYHNDTGHIIREPEEDPPPSPAYDEAGHLKSPSAPADRPRTAADDSAAPRSADTPQVPRRRKLKAPEPTPPPPPGRVLTLHIQRTDDPARDQRRIKMLHGQLIEHPGHDHFRFVLEGPGDQRKCLNFPNQPIEISEEMLAFVCDKLGEDNVVVTDA